MADKPAKKKSGSWLILTPMILLAGTFLLPTTILVVAGMIPTALSYSVDRERGKLTSSTIGAMNFAALTPVLLRLWSNGQTLENALKMVTNPLIWILVLLGAMVGWVMAQVVPPLVVGLIATRDRRLLHKIRDRQKALIDEWGQAVSEGGR